MQREHERTKRELPDSRDTKDQEGDKKRSCVTLENQSKTLL
jgi:hypothetical protein